MDTIFGGLIEFNNQSEFNTFINKMTKEDSMKIIELALEYGTKTGLFSMEENVAIYNSLQNLKTDKKKIYLSILWVNKLVILIISINIRSTRNKHKDTLNFEFRFRS